MFHLQNVKLSTAFRITFIFIKEMQRYNTIVEKKIVDPNNSWTQKIVVGVRISNTLFKKKKAFFLANTVSYNGYYSNREIGDDEYSGAPAKKGDSDSIKPAKNNQQETRKENPTVNISNRNFWLVSNLFGCMNRSKKTDKSK